MGQPVPSVTPGAETMKRASRQAGCFRSMCPLALCPKCGEGRIETHIPLYVAGTFCSKCCPVCSPQGQDAGDAGKREPVEVKP
jgi:ribosomal protein L32